MKKLLALVLAAVMPLALLAGCGRNSNTPSNTTPPVFVSALIGLMLRRHGGHTFTSKHIISIRRAEDAERGCMAQ